ncbi:MAG: Catechol 2,3-dioxygenase [Chloroflexi bacterium]|nr:MAG: Catechol 2,3-dioxygenase [Chloroflexota bacterium]
MPIDLNHTIVPSRDKVAAAQWFERIFGLEYAGAMGHFAPVQVNATLTLDYDDAPEFESHHYAFHVDEATFAAIFARLEAEAVVYGSGPGSSSNMRTNHRGGGQGVYFRDPDGHLLELLTVA